MKPPAKSNRSRERAGTKTAGAGGFTLAERISTAPRLIDAKAAHARLADWVSGLAAAEKPLRALFAKNPTLRTLLQSLAESSPFLWDTVSRDPERLLRLLQTDPDRHLAASLNEYGRDIAASTDEVEAMRLLRLLKGETALLIALADIGGVWPVMRAARALSDLADAAVDAATRFLLAEATRAGRFMLKDKANPQTDSGYIVLAMGKMGAFELNYSSDIDLI